MAVEDVLARLRTNQLPIYAIGYTGLPMSQRQTYLDVLHRFANASGGVYREADSAALAANYAAIQQAIRRVFVAHFVCQECIADGQPEALEVKLSQGKVLTDSVNVVPANGARVPPPSWWKRIPGLVYWAAGALLVLLFILILIRRRKTKSETVLSPIPQPIALPTRTTAPSTAIGPAVNLRFTVVTGKEPGRTHEVRLVQTAVIGRNRECDLSLPDDPKISGRHCELALVNDKVVIYDLGSTNSTSVNGVPIHGRHRLENRDSLLLGSTELRVRIEESQ
jgi:hypothetical protein